MLTGYEGEFCQNDADGCEMSWRSRMYGLYAAPEVGAECSCPDGYVGGNNSKCVGR